MDFKSTKEVDILNHIIPFVKKKSEQKSSIEVFSLINLFCAKYRSY